MSFNNINTKLRSERGFTIVELLIVIVVIGILAAITIVSFNGVTAKANTTSAQSAAATALKKAEAYNAEKQSYPTPAQMTGAAASETFGLSGVTFNNTEVTGSTKPAATATLNYYKCGTTGAQVTYFNYSDNSWKVQSTGSGCPTTPATGSFVAGNA